VPLDLREIEAGVARLDASYERSNQLVTAGAPQRIEASHSQVEQELNELIERQPDEVAQTLRSWLADRRA
jgi:flagellar biosynthesis/type III secretory pathway M-ring protein FliF/YscJ